MAASGGGPDAPHRPVLLFEAVNLLAPSRGGLFVDATLGLGGHSEAILEASPDTRVLGIDRDREALRLASERLARFGTRFRAVHANFREMRGFWTRRASSEASGVLADLGVSSLQFDSPERGFSFRHDAPLDMRMDAGGRRRDGRRAARTPAGRGDRARHLRVRRGAQIAPHRALDSREARAGRAGQDDRGAGRVWWRAPSATSAASRIHPATRTFQALRIAVNGELEGLDEFVETAVDLLQTAGTPRRHQLPLSGRPRREAHAPAALRAVRV